MVTSGVVRQRPPGARDARAIVGMVNVEAYGAVPASKDPTFDNGPAFMRAAASAGDGVLLIPGKTYTFGTTFSLADLSCGVQGMGQRTVLRGLSSLAGPVMDITGWTCPSGQVGCTPIGRFNIHGAGAADATKARSGLKITNLTGVDLHDIGIRDTGGPAIYWHGYGWEMAFRNIVASQPIGANANDVPYIDMRGWFNGIMFHNIGLRCEVNHAVAGLSADGMVAWLIEDDGTITMHGSTFIGCWTENQRTPEGGSILRWAMNDCTIDLPEVFDSTATAAATTNTCILRLTGPVNGSIQDFGGNLVRGIVYGRTSEANRYADGVVLQQSRNAVVGVKGYNGRNVRITSGVQYCHVELSGMVAGVGGATTAAAVQDDSGNSDNVIIDWTRPHLRLRGLPLAQGAALGTNQPGLQIGDTWGAVQLGTGGVKIRNTSGNPGYAYLDSDLYTFRALDATTLLAALDANGFSILGGSRMKKAVAGAITWNPGSLVDGASESISFTLTGATVGQPCYAGLGAITTGGWQLSAHCTSADTVTVTLTNRTGGTVDLGSSSLRVIQQQI